MNNYSVFKGCFFVLFILISFLGFIRISYSSQAGIKVIKSYFVDPSDNLNFANYHYVGSHNADTYEKFYKIVRQQDEDVTSQLRHGIRGLNFNTHDWPSIRDPFMTKYKDWSQGKVVLSHGKPGVEAFTQKGFTDSGKVEYQTFLYELFMVYRYIQNFNPKAVITIFLDHYANTNDLLQDIQYYVDHLKRNNVPDYLFKPSDWDPYKDIKNGKGNKQVWPTLGWMRKNKKQIMICLPKYEGTDKKSTVKGNTKFTWSKFDYYFENMWDEFEPPEVCKYRGSPKPSDRVLSLFNYQKGKHALTTQIYSGEFAIPSLFAPWELKNLLSYENIQRVVASCSKFGFANGKIPNVFLVDRGVPTARYIKAHNKKTLFDYVNELNKK